MATSRELRRSLKRQMRAAKRTHPRGGRPSRAERSRARRELRHEVRTQRERLGRNQIFAGRNDRLLGGLAGLMVVGGIAVIVWLGGGEEPLATPLPPTSAPLVLTSPSPQLSVEPVVTPAPTPDGRQGRGGNDHKGNGSGGNGNGGGGGASTAPPTTAGTGTGTGGGGSSPKPDPKPEPTSTDKPGPTK